jgi:hypothetical protein
MKIDVRHLLAFAWLPPLLSGVLLGWPILAIIGALMAFGAATVRISNEYEARRRTDRLTPGWLVCLERIRTYLADEEMMS